MGPLRRRALDRRAARASRALGRPGGGARPRVDLPSRSVGPAGCLAPVFEAVAVLAAGLPEPTLADPWTLEGARACRLTSESIYAEQWLFHGPALQAVSHVGRNSATGIEGRLRVLPFEPIVRPGFSSDFHTDVIVIDSFTHLFGCWGLDHLADRGDVVFPLRLEELRIFGPRPEVGTEVDCRVAIRELAAASGAR